MLLETVYAPRVSLPNAADVVNDGSVQAPLPLEVGGGVAGVEAGAEAVAVGLDWVGEAEGDVPGEEADSEDDAADDADAEGDACDGDAEVPAVGVAGPVAAAIFSSMAACLALVAACRGT